MDTRTISEEVNISNDTESESTDSEDEDVYYPQFILSKPRETIVSLEESITYDQIIVKDRNASANSQTSSHNLYEVLMTESHNLQDTGDISSGRFSSKLEIELNDAKPSALSESKTEEKKVNSKTLDTMQTKAEYEFKDVKRTDISESKTDEKKVNSKALDTMQTKPEYEFKDVERNTKSESKTEEKQFNSKALDAIQTKPEYEFKDVERSAISERKKEEKKVYSQALDTMQTRTVYEFKGVGRGAISESKTEKKKVDSDKINLSSTSFLRSSKEYKDCDTASTITVKPKITNREEKHKGEHFNIGRNTVLKTKSLYSSDCLQMLGSYEQIKKETMSSDYAFDYFSLPDSQIIPVFNIDESKEQNGNQSKGTKVFQASRDDPGRKGYGMVPELMESRKPVIQLYFGALTDIKVDVIVNSIGKQLDLSFGALSKSILEKGGVEIQQELRQKYPRGLRPNKVAITKGGKLPCKNILHVVLNEWNQNSDECLKTFQKIIKLCLKEAEERRMTSIAFPAIGTGNLNYPPTVVAGIMLDRVMAFRNKHIETVEFVVLLSDNEVVEAFEKKMKQLDIKPCSVGKTVTEMKVEQIKSWPLYPVSTTEQTWGKKPYIDGIEAVQDAEMCTKFPYTRYTLKRIVPQADPIVKIVNLPSDWTRMEPGVQCKEVELNPGDPDYDQTKEQLNTVYVIKIARIQNIHLYKQYEAKLEEIEFKTKTNPEQLLWHGTSEDRVDKIINNGFNRSYCGKNGTLYGEGVYFAVRAETSLIYGTKHLFLSKVATGRFCRGTRNMKVLPQIPGNASHVAYDSATDSTNNPSLFVIFHDAQAYPWLHITFQKK